MANEYLKRTNTSAANRKAFTYSFWMKGNDLETGNQARPIYNYDGSSLLQLMIERSTGTNPGYWVLYASGTDIRWEAMRNDPSAWYHVVLSVNTTRTQEQDRVLLYVNGVRMNALGSQTGSPGTPSFPALNSKLYHDVNYINGIAGSSKYQLTDYYYVDGKAFDADVFGFNKEGDGYASVGSNQATDFRPGQWSPHAPRRIKTEIERRGGFGTNGYYLPLNDSSNPGADFHCTPNSIIKLKGEDLPQPRNGAPTTSDAYVSELREEPATLGFDGCIKLDGNDGIDVAANAALDLGTGDFTIEAFYYLKDQGTYHSLFDGRGTGGDGLYMSLFRHNSENKLYLYANSAVRINDIPRKNNQWFHIAICRSSGTTRAFIDGELAGSFSDTFDYVCRNLLIGQSQNNTNDLYGFVSNFRIVKGTALYTSNFTRPTSPLENVSNTILLCANSSTSATASTVTPSTITAIGDVFATKNELTGSIILAVPGISTATGANLITNGGFDDGISGWTAVDATVTWEWETGSIRIVPNSGVNGAVYQSITTVIGQRYTLSVDVVGANPISVPPSPYARIHVGTTTDITLNERYLHTGQTAAHNVSIGNYTLSFTATTTTTTVWLEVGGGNQTQVDFDNVVVKQENAPRDYSADIRGSGSTLSLTPNGNIGVGYGLGGYYGSAINCGGNADYLEVDTPVLGPGDWLIEEWFKQKTDQDSQGYWDVSLGVNGDSNSTGGASIYHVEAAAGSGQDGEISFIGHSNQYRIYGYQDVRDDCWHHVAVEKHNNVVTLYIDGVAKSSSPDTYDYDSTDNTLIGASTIAQTNYYTGLIADVRVYAGVAKYKGGFDVPKPYSAGDSNFKNLNDWRITSDTPVDNFATLNPLAMMSGVSFSNGNLTVTGSAAYRSTPATMGMHSGKWYVEFYWNTWMNDCHLGIMNDLSPNITGTWAGTTAPGYAWAGSGGRLYNNGNIFGSFLHTYTTGDVCQIAFDADTGNLYFGKNGTWLDGASPSTGSGANWTGLTDGPYHFFVTTTNTSPVVTVNFGQNPSFCGSLSAGTESDGNGNGLFKYSVPTNFLALCDNNLPAPAIADPGKHFKTVLYTGDGAEGRQITGVGFKPDLVWIKCRDVARWHPVFDVIRGTTNRLFTNATDAQSSSATSLISFDKDGFSVGSLVTNNGSAEEFVAWCWKAGGAPVTNNDGSVSSLVSANQEAGFSIVKFTAQTSGSITLGHGLGKKPAFWIWKDINGATGWYTYHKSLGSSAWLKFDGLEATTGNAAAWGGTDPTDTVLTNGSGFVNQNDVIMYVWAEIEGYSRFGSYTGNQDDDGPFVHCGFKPAFLMIKLATGDGRDWHIYDSCRNSVNPVSLNLRPSGNDIENDEPGIHFLANGFKITKDWIFSNKDTSTIVYAAFAESPFQTANAK